MSKSLKLFAAAGAGAAALLVGAANFGDRNIARVSSELTTMSAAPESVFSQLIASAEASTALAEGALGLGRLATPEEVAAWDIDVRPDGLGLPVGSGDVVTGEEVYLEKCAVCHGDFGEGAGRWPVLTGGMGSLTSERPEKTTGSYWPYLSTVYDYIYRAMPFTAPESLTHDETYAIVAYLMNMNDLVDDDFVLSNENFAELRLPNEPNFIDDDRATTEIPVFTKAEVCMENCKESVEITAHASVLDVTPEETAAKAAAKAEGAEAPQTAEATTETAAAEAPAEPAAEPAKAEEAPAAAGGLDAALVAEGEKVFKKCKACHQVGDGAKNKSGPHLNGVMGRAMASSEGFNYSATLAEMGAGGAVWDEASLAEFLANPKGYVSGTKMSFAGLKKEGDIKAVTEYLKSFSQ